jgi:1-acyl-sn-glycerol-3-phosphate acyltransferase
MFVSLLRAFVIICITIPFSLIATAGSLVQRSLRIFYWVTRTWPRMVMNVCNVSLTVRGVEYLQPGTAYVFVANHASMFDILAVLAGIPGRVNLILKKELTRVPIWGWGLLVSPYIVIDRSNARKAMQSLEQAEQRIRNGASVLLFPEGTRTRDGKMQPFKRGAFSLAARSGAPIVPVTINGSFRILPKGSFRINSGHIELVIHKPILQGTMDEPALRQKVEEHVKESYKDQS